MTVKRYRLYYEDVADCWTPDEEIENEEGIRYWTVAVGDCLAEHFPETAGHDEITLVVSDEMVPGAHEIEFIDRDHFRLDGDGPRIELTIALGLIFEGQACMWIELPT